MLHFLYLAQRVQLTESKKISVNALECTLCKYIVGYVENTLGTNRSSAAVEALLEKVCNVLPASVKPNCTAFVTKYGPIIAFLFGKNESAEQICDFIKVCTNATQEITPRKYNIELFFFSFHDRLFM
jgi:hypothetical protein